MPVLGVGEGVTAPHKPPAGRLGRWRHQARGGPLPPAPAPPWAGIPSPPWIGRAIGLRGSPGEAYRRAPVWLLAAWRPGSARGPAGPEPGAGGARASRGKAGRPAGLL